MKSVPLGDEVWQHANQKAQGLTDRRLGTAASKENSVIALEHDVHKQVNSAQRAIDAASQTPVENITANIAVLRRLGVAPPGALDALERMALQHARRLGF